MCARFTLTTPDYKDLEELLQAQMYKGVEDSYRPRFNVAPTEDHWILAASAQGDRIIYPAHWGLTNYWAESLRDGVRQINARSETAHSKRSFKEAFARRRCIVPADGFFEWTGPRKKRQPIWFHRSDGGLLLLGGLYEDYKDRDLGVVRTFTILTQDAVGEVAEVHDRMPVVFGEDQIDDWILQSAPEADVDKLRELLESVHETELVGRRVSRRVNRAGVDDDPTLLDPASDDPPPQGSLF